MDIKERRIASVGWSAIFYGEIGSETGRAWFKQWATLMRGGFQGGRMRGGKNGVNSNSHGEFWFYRRTGWGEKNDTVDYGFYGEACFHSGTHWVSTVENGSCRKGEIMQSRIPVLLMLVWDRCIDIRVPCRDVERSTANDSITWSAAPFDSAGLNAKFREVNVDMLIEIFWSFADSFHAQVKPLGTSPQYSYPNRLRVRSGDFSKKIYSGCQMRFRLLPYFDKVMFSPLKRLSPPPHHYFSQSHPNCPTCHRRFG